MPLPPTQERVRGATLEEVNQEIDRETIERLKDYADCEEMIDRRLLELDREWDIERVLEANAAGLILIGLIKSKWSLKWLALPFAVAAFLLLHALRGWCPPIPIFRRLGIRTAREINNERTALMLLRGDFDEMVGAEQADVEELFELMRVEAREE